MPVWQANYALGTEGEGIVVLEGEGRVAARVGAKVYMGGGEVGQALKGINAVDERTKRELSERCPGTYWLVGLGVSIP